VIPDEHLLGRAESWQFGNGTLSALEFPTVVLGKAREVGVRVTAGAVPLPLKLTDCGLLAALSVIATLVDLDIRDVQVTRTRVLNG
jgi:hypothetical protein